MAFNLSAGVCKQKAFIHHKSCYINWNLLLKGYNFLQLQLKNFVYTPRQAATHEKSCLLMRQK